MDWLNVVAVVGAVGAVCVALAAWIWPRTAKSTEPWTLELVSKSRYRLTNLTGGRVSEVTCDGNGWLGRLSDAGPWEQIDAGGAVEFLAVVSFQSGVPTLTFRWKDGRGRSHDWSTVLPFVK